MPEGVIEGQQLGRVRIIRQIGFGAMGTVYEGLEEPEGRQVAVKILRPELLRSPEMVARFFNEAKALMLIGHPGTVSIRDSGVLGEIAYLVMEFLSGDTLRDRLKHGALLPGYAQHLAWQLAATVAAAHEKGIIHRDLKPGNVMIVADAAAPAGERVKLLDFGLAKLLENESGEALTHTGFLMGTPAYMSPEQCRGAGTVTGRSDVYALGVILYELLAGRKPFRGEAPGDLIAQHLYATPWPLAELAPSASPELVDLVRRMLAKKPESRPTMREVEAELHALGASRPVLSALTMSSPPRMASPLHESDEVRASLDRGLKASMRADVRDRVSLEQARRRSLDPGQPTGVRPQTADVLRGTNDRGPHSGPSGRHAVRTSGKIKQVPRRGRTWVGGLLIIVMLALVAGGELWWYLRLDTPPPVSNEPARAPTAPTTVRWRVRSRPSGAVIVRTADGKVLGKTPWLQFRPATPAQEELELRLPGYYPRPVMLHGSNNEEIDQRLEPDPTRRGPRGR